MFGSVLTADAAGEETAVVDTVETPTRADAGPGRDPLERIRADLDALAREDPDPLGPAGRDARVVGLVGLIERAQATLVRTLAAWDQAGDWAADGSLSPRAALTHRTVLGRRNATHLIRDARLTAEHPEIDARLTDGRLSAEHLRLLAATATTTRRARLADDLAVLLDAAHTLPTDDYALALRRWAALVDDETDRDSHPGRTNDVTLAPTMGGWHLAGWLDPETGELLTQALEAACPPDPATRPGGVRCAAERRADALRTLAASYLTDPTTGTVRCRLVLHASLDALTRHRIDPTTHLADLDRHGPIPIPTLERLACDPHLERVIFAGPGQILDLGRTTRIVPAALRRALEARDRHCRWPGCDRPATWADAHHIIPWARGGPTNLENTVLLCAAHHRQLHDERWHLTLDPHTAHVTITPNRPCDERATRTHDPPEP